MYENCWEIKNCGREPGGEYEHFGVCPVFDATQYNNINHGKNGGRMCWFITGTLCGGEIQGTYTQKKKICITCNVYKQIKEEENHDFLITQSSKT